MMEDFIIPSPTGMGWKKASEKGELCGILGCGATPVKKCPHCGNYYCEEHKVVIDTPAHNFGQPQ